MTSRLATRKRLSASLLLAVTLWTASAIGASDLVVEVRDEGARPIRDAVVYAIPLDATRLPAPKPATMDQQNRTFVPHILAIQTGAAVSFPNSDNIRHQVYSFSPPKRFQIPLYEGTPERPIVFDKPGVLALGCNIHDRMSAFIVVVDTPYFGVADDGSVELLGLPPGGYEVRVWSPARSHSLAPRTVRLKATGRSELVISSGADSDQDSPRGDP